MEWLSGPLGVEPGRALFDDEGWRSRFNLTGNTRPILYA